MKNPFLAFIALAVIAVSPTTSVMAAQTPAHAATSTWGVPADATAASTVTISRTAGSCSGSAGFTVLASGLSMTQPYVDTTVTAGTYCYIAQQVLNGASSVPSNSAPVTVSPLPPLNFLVTVK